MRLGCVDHVAQFHRQLAVAHLGFVGGDLHGDREELSIVPVDVGLQERLELFCASHDVCLRVLAQGRCPATPRLIVRGHR